MGTCYGTDQTNVNFDILIRSIKDKDVTNTRVIIENSTAEFQKYYQGLTFYHYLVIYTLHYNKDKLQELCDIIYVNRNRFGSVKRIAYDWKYVRIYEYNDEYCTTYTDNDKYWDTDENNYIQRDDIYKLKNLDPMSLCLELKTKFLKKEKLDDNMEIVVGLLRKISDMSQNS